MDALRAKRTWRLPTLLTKEETLRLTGCLAGTHQSMAKLIYGSGLCLLSNQLARIPSAVVSPPTCRKLVTTSEPLTEAAWPSAAHWTWTDLSNTGGY